MSSVISASRLWEGRMSEPSEAKAGSREDDSGFGIGDEGLTSERTPEGVIELSTEEAVGMEYSRGVLGVRAVALDIRRTNKGRMCFPSDCV